MKLIACGCIVFALVDYFAVFVGYDLTGVSWSPAVAMFIGGTLLRIAE